ncbi:TetR/AcrR family transcriptional regulator [Amycolatopsis sp. K13G38]|uniref:TetR/AcrR family transcriptional regulator n=1 Tax=Amycolatopsis acididurans TaxID=2724524 RepID=A0ABX1IVQ5_9PSEU|nr:TetR/AcrR family transcriptional regulator [Amycolatopsis acididurans]NKQ51570.1 TetR/AcrR family transcriptional regulator [Amycolatopsis acididurans]
MNDPEPRRRPYDSPIRRQRAAQTRERIVAAGAELVHERPVWDWRLLTARTVAERAGVNERTVYRHFATERGLRDAVLQRLQQEAGVTAAGTIELDDIADITARTFAYVSSFPTAERKPADATFAAVDKRRRDSLLDAVGRAAADWPEEDRTAAAAMLDVLWSLVSYERLVTAWELDPKQATRAIRWVMGMVENEIRQGRRPAP